jgi:hypothetical protein
MHICKSPISHPFVLGFIVSVGDNGRKFFLQFSLDPCPLYSLSLYFFRTLTVLLIIAMCHCVYQIVKYITLACTMDGRDDRINKSVAVHSMGERKCCK